MPINFSSPTSIGGTTLLKTRIGEPILGEIVRVLNSGSVTDATGPYKYTNLYDEPDQLFINSGQTGYFLIKSGSYEELSSRNLQITPATGIIIVNRLLITGSSIGNNFTEVVLTNVGNGTWNKPNGITEVVVECWGGGGGGGGAATTGNGGGGGASGTFVRSKIIYASASQNISYTIGGGGAGGTGVGSGNAGGDTTWQTNTVIAKGGGGGLGEAIDNPNGGGQPQSGDVAELIISGSPGGFPLQGREGAVSGKGGDYNVILFGGNIEFYGQGGLELIQINGSANGNPGSLYAAGGGGAVKDTGPNRTGGDGAQGLIRLIYR